MATELTKYHLVPNINNNNNNIVTEFKGQFFPFKTKKTSVFIYGVVFVFIAITIFLAFSPPSSTSTSSWFINIFTLNSTSLRSPIPSDFSSNLTQNSLVNSSRSQNTTSVQLPTFDNSQNSTSNQLSHDKVENFESNITNSTIPENPTTQISTNLPQISPVSSNQDENFDLTNDNNNNYNNNNNNNTSLPEISTKNPPILSKFEPNDTNIDTIVTQISPKISPISSDVNGVANLNFNTTMNPQNQGNLSTSVLPKIPAQNSQPSGNQPVSSNGQKGNEVKENGIISNFTTLVDKPESNSENGTVLGKDKKKEGKNLVGSLIGCDLYDGEWVRDDTYPLYKPGSCKFIDEQFNCQFNGRPDSDYQKLKWKPKGCTLPRMNGRKMLKLLRGKRLVFVGDSLNRNMWESLVCILKNSVKNPKSVFEAHGRRYFRGEASYTFVFKDNNSTVEFFVAPFLVTPWDVKDKSGRNKETLRLDLMVGASEHFKTADIIIFNTGHWWTHEKTSKGEDYYQEGNNVYQQLDVKEAFRKAITTWGRWVDTNINPQKTHVFFRGYSNTHFHGGQWNSGGQCDNETEPITNEIYLTKYPWKMKVLETVMKGIKIPISYLNITRMTDYRKDAHPSIYRKYKPSGEEKISPLKFQDCSHWCLPGVPDLWNELLYAEILRKKYQNQQRI